MTRPRPTRRRFLAGCLAASGAGFLMPTARLLGANDDIRVAVIGCGWKGGGHIGTFSSMPGVRLVAVSDADTDRMDQKTRRLEPAPAKHQDFRRILDDKNIDAVVIATPNHWHALMTILACQAGKHVYVEKPVSHCIWEGRQMVRAARQYKRVVQAGTQHRSDLIIDRAAADLLSGRYGKCLWAHCMRLAYRKPIGLVTEPQPVPPNIDYELWAGPAPKTPVMRKSFHYDWHWQFNWGDGEMGNWGPHYIDDCRRVLGMQGLPSSVVTAGNRFAWQDNGDTPNVEIALMQWHHVTIIADYRNLEAQAGTRSSARIKLMQFDNGQPYYRGSGTFFMLDGDAVMVIDRGGGAVLSKKDGSVIRRYRGTGGKGHEENFIDAVRANDPTRLNAEIEIGHRSTAMCHLANISYRAARDAGPDQVRQAFQDTDDGRNTVQAVLDQLAAVHVDLGKTPFKLGPRLTYDWKNETFTGPNAALGNRWLKLAYRKPFVVPEQV